MPDVYEDRCEKFGLDVSEVRRLTARLARAARDADRIGLQIFGGSGRGSLRVKGRKAEGLGTLAEVADLGLNFDGGDGGDEYL